MKNSPLVQDIFLTKKLDGKDGTVIILLKLLYKESELLPRKLGKLKVKGPNKPVKYLIDVAVLLENRRTP